MGCRAPCLGVPVLGEVQAQCTASERTEVPASGTAEMNTSDEISPLNTSDEISLPAREGKSENISVTLAHAKNQCPAMSVIDSDPNIEVCCTVHTEGFEGTPSLKFSLNR